MQFRLGSIPVRIHASFFVMAVLLGATGDRDPTRIAIWVGIVAASIFVHELGHAMMGRAFGLAPAIDLYAMGGLTSWPQGKEVSNGKRVAISLAGPGVGLAVAAVLMLTGAVGLTPNVSLLDELLGTAPVQRETLALVATRAALFVNGAWSLFNLLPMLPLDGGNVTLHSLNLVTNGRGERAARIISLVIRVWYPFVRNSGFPASGKAVNTMHVIVKVQRKGQVTIPTRLRARVGLADGDLLEATELRGRIILTPKLVVRETTAAM